MGTPSTTRPISVLIIAHNPLLRDGIVRLLNEQPDLRAIAATPAWDVIISLVVEMKPQVVLLDSCLGSEYSIRLLNAVKDATPTIPRLIVMDLLGAPEEVVEFVEAGCSGLILKNTTLEHFIGTVRSVAQGVSVLPAELAETIFSYVVRQAAGRETEVVRQAVLMTPREREVMALIAEGRSNKEIGERLHISVHTVKSHVHLILEKLALHSRLQIAAYSRRSLG